jgi:hypothetical protein
MPLPTPGAIIAGLLACASVMSAAGMFADEQEPFLLLTRDGQLRPIRLASISDQSLVHMDPARGWTTLDLAQCIALLNREAEATDDRPGSSRSGAAGVVMLADGQRMPGEPALDAPPQTDVLAWQHPWLGRVDVPLKAIESVLLSADAIAPPAGEDDVVLLANGDVQAGLVTAIGDPVSVEVGAGATRQTVDIPLARVVAIRMIAPRPAGDGRRLWFNEGTVLDVQSLGVGDDGLVRMGGSALAPANPGQQRSVGIDEIAAILFDRQRLLPLALQTPSRIEGPATRYTLPRPLTVDPHAPLGLSAVELSGPITVRYVLPAGCERFIADAELPRAARAWGDCELIVRSDDQEVFHVRLNAAVPQASINVPLRGRELTIEIAAGVHGPIQDLIRLHRPLLLKGAAR